MILIGLTASGFFLNTSFDGWTSEPVITTLDTIAAPISQIQFPTVTVCQNDLKQPDRWSLIEKVLNFVSFECQLSHIYAGNFAYENDCNLTQHVRNDFDFLIKKVADDMKKWTMFHPSTKEMGFLKVNIKRLGESFCHKESPAV